MTATERQRKREKKQEQLKHLKDGRGEKNENYISGQRVKGHQLTQLKPL